MQLFRGCKDDTILWFIILFVLLFFCGNCGNLMNTGCNDGCHEGCSNNSLFGNNCGCCD